VQQCRLSGLPLYVWAPSLSIPYTRTGFSYSIGVKHLTPLRYTILTILRVPQFPVEDTKLRAEKVTRRRGGNVGNTLEVLSDIISYWHGIPDSETRKLHLIAPLPEQNSADAAFIRDSMNTKLVDLAGPFHDPHPNAASCVILQSKERATRTIVSHSDLPALTLGHFNDIIRQVIDNLSVGSDLWVHFEGRNSEFELDCVRALRLQEGCGDFKCRISIECENPARQGAHDAARYADIVFYSKLWAEVRTLMRFPDLKQGRSLITLRVYTARLDLKSFLRCTCKRRRCIGRSEYTSFTPRVVMSLTSSPG
jgi:hypothetical protein